ncbi:MAG TPA: hypothetical protein GXZ27_00340 [Thermoanaerobacterales bacterium]|jgi:hypothetical protein|nr:hypothetical protein [Thermoanaerobacterales bacterium]
MMSINLSQNTSADSPGSNPKPQPNPYTLFLILILLINSFGGVNRIIKNIKNLLTKQEEV